MLRPARVPVPAVGDGGAMSVAGCLVRDVDLSRLSYHRGVEMRWLDFQRSLKSYCG